ncbi:MAG: DNA polymerase III subunit delta' [Burkholderiales bacterium]|nr:DNA polymerase III subunit delta' [Burkholderiales bacterium]
MSNDDSSKAPPLTLLPWQHSAWQQIQVLRQNMPHALLFYGNPGIGKTRFIQVLAQALLCENGRSDGLACGSCPSCTWFLEGNHPDFRCVRPERMEPEPADDASKEIKIDQVRLLADFMNISTHRSGLRVVVLYPAETLNLASSNALLKTLEEPPPKTVFLLATNSIDQLLPTILSRCRKFALGMPGQAESLAWLSAQGVRDAANWLAEQGGAPLTAFEMAQVGKRDELDFWLQFLALPSLDGALKTAEKLQKTPVPQLLAWLQRWLYDVLSCRLASTIRYYPRYQKEIAALAARVDLGQLLAVQKSCKERAAIAEHPLAPKLFIEDMLLEYVTICR